MTKKNNASIKIIYYKVMSKFMYSDMTLSVFPEVDFAGESPRSERAVSGLDRLVPTSSSLSGGSGAQDAARSRARVLLLVLIGEGDWGSSVGEVEETGDTIPRAIESSALTSTCPANSPLSSPMVTSAVVVACGRSVDPDENVGGPDVARRNREP
jgi:hypothetical protein